MRLWRISDWPDLSGAGAVAFPGRWNRAGRPLVYLADTSALAILEVLVHQPRTVLPPPFQLLEIASPDELQVTHWPDNQHVLDRELTVDWGDAFVRAGETPLARVPSAIAPQSWNYLLNPLHADAAQVMVVNAGRWPWDARLFAQG
ncbi:RES family NAD+ phosphorylase [uncultured Sphingomonas sp.]|uniref:RES family NAD+ phosphorylase n=1 Tax=uncultured Sphingomonas sp. TaxID=158754 RepID=UPI0035CA344C